MSSTASTVVYISIIIRNSLVLIQLAYQANLLGRTRLILRRHKHFPYKHWTRQCCYNDGDSIFLWVTCCCWNRKQQIHCTCAVCHIRDNYTIGNQQYFGLASVLKPGVTLCKFVYCKFQIVSNKPRSSNETTQRSVTDVVTMATEPATTPSLDKDANLYISKTVALPIWLIAVIAGGAVITTLTITAIIWIYCKMRQR